MYQIIIPGIAIASAWTWIEELIKGRRYTISWWLLIRVPQGIAIAWTLNILGIY